MKIVVEDSPKVREWIVRILMQHAHEVVEHADGLSAWQELKAEAEFDVILADYEMPRMDGLELLRQVRADPKLKEKHFVLASGYLPLEVERKARELDVRLLKKPCSTPELIEVLRPRSDRQSFR